jgi:hypothetical protein
MSVVADAMGHPNALAWATIHHMTGIGTGLTQCGMGSALVKEASILVR